MTSRIQEHRPATLSRFLGRTVSSDAFDLELGQLVCFAGSVVVLFTSWWNQTTLELGEAQLFFGLLLSLCPPLLLVLVGLVLPGALRARQPQH